MGVTYYDSEGTATFLFGGVPIRAVKRAFFKNKLGTIQQLLKLAYNSVTYDFSQTAEGGAVIFNNNYTGWEFIAPDNRINFSGFANMTLGQAFESMKRAITNAPIPAWEQFTTWLNQNKSTVNLGISAFSAYIRAVGDSTMSSIEPVQFSTLTGFVDFIETLESICEPVLERPASDFKTGDKSFACEILFYRSNGQRFLTMTVTFRE